MIKWTQKGCVAGVLMGFVSLSFLSAEAKSVAQESLVSQQQVLCLDLASLDLSPQHATSLISKTNQRLGLGLDFLLAAVIHKDFSKPSDFLSQRIQRGWQLSFEPDWQSRFFTQVFHSWFYLQDASNLSPAIQKHLREIEATLIQETQTLWVKLPEQKAVVAPVFASHSGQKNQYQINLNQAEPVQRVLADSEYTTDYAFLYRASASQASPEEHERWALNTLLEEPGAELAATAVWRYYQAYLGSGQNKAEAFNLASQNVEQALKGLLDRDELESELLAVINWNTGFRPEEVFFLSGDYTTTALYGSVIFILQQQIERGIPLNEYGHHTGFYQQLPYEWLMSVQGFWLFAVADRAEYLLPAYLGHSEILGVDVRAERTMFSAEATRTGSPGILLRKYRKYYDQQSQQLFVYVLDAQDQWMGTFYKSHQPGSGLVSDSIPQQDWSVSRMALPSFVLKDLPAGVVYIKANAKSLIR